MGAENGFMAKQLNKGAYEIILRGRTPGAVVHISGNAGATDLSGEAELYTTPLGVVICAEFSGLPETGRTEIFGLRVGNDVLPVYARTGDAWCASITHRTGVSDIIGQTVSVLRGRSESIGCGTVCRAIYGT